jgi:phosphatidate cytidylyltransferase
VTDLRPHPAAAPAGSATGRSNLALRVASALVLAPLAIAIAYFGGWPFVLFWALAALGILWEWAALVAGPTGRSVFLAGAGPLVIATVLAGLHRPLAAMLIIAVGAVGAAAFAPTRERPWIAVGVIYAGAILVAPVVLRSDAEFGFVAVLLLFAVVWTTDVVAYFVGRALGGPKLLPRVSPNKTWSGALAGTVAAIIVAIALVSATMRTPLFPIVMVAAVLSVVAQVGDLLESAVKRRFGAKDAGQLIPGHGGLMDRLDGFLLAAAAAALFGGMRESMEAAARGLLMWVR